MPPHARYRRIMSLKCYCDQIFTLASHRIPGKIKNAIYHLQISALVLERFKFEKCVVPENINTSPKEGIFAKNRTPPPPPPPPPPTPPQNIQLFLQT